MRQEVLGAWRQTPEVDHLGGVLLLARQHEAEI
jgi:hypothetical protein